MDRYKFIGSSYLFFTRGDLILLLKRKNTGYEDGNYGLVSGHLESGETARQGAAREAFEESGVTISPGNLELAHVMHRKATKDERIDFFFKVIACDGEPVNKEPDKCEELKWFHKAELPENTIPYIRNAIQCILEGKLYSEFGWQ